MTSAKYTIHESAIVQTDNIGNGTRIWAFCNIQAGAEIGEDCNICDHCFVERNVVIGNRVTVKNGVALFDGLIVEDDVFIGPGAVFTNDIYPRSKVRHREYEKIYIKQGATIGAGAVIVAGHSIGKYAFIGAGAVVTKDIPDYTLWYGNPARQEGYICKCTKRFDLNAVQTDNSVLDYTCTCGNIYRLENGKIVCKS